MSTDPYLTDCVLCSRPRKGRSNFCAECGEEGAAEMNFGRCYHCDDYGDHQDCIGPPCQCPCPPPDELKRQKEREEVLAKLTPHERAILGY